MRAVTRFVTKMAVASNIGCLLGTPLLAAMLSGAPAAAQQATGVPGSPGATTTIPGNQLPPPQPPFGGVIRETLEGSRTWWPPQIVPPRDAPNVLLIMTDDQGYGVPGTFGGVIPTPALDRIANAGLRYTQFHSTALCSPDPCRASSPGAIITPLASASSLNAYTGYPGYDADDRSSTMARSAEILKQNGYATSWFGKNHNTPDPVAVQYAAGPFDPMADRHGLRLFLRLHGRRDQPMDAVSLPATTTQIFPWIGKPSQRGYKGCADRPTRISLAGFGGHRRRNIQGNLTQPPDKPFFLYYAPGGTPLAAPADAGVDRQVQGQVRHGLECHARSDLCQPEAAWA